MFQQIIFLYLWLVFYGGPQLSRQKQIHSKEDLKDKNAPELFRSMDVCSNDVALHDKCSWSSACGQLGDEPIISF